MFIVLWRNTVFCAVIDVFGFLAARFMSWTCTKLYIYFAALQLCISVSMLLLHVLFIYIGVLYWGRWPTCCSFSCYV